MNVKQFIASGILEKYVLGLATAKEQQEVLRFASEYPEVKAEIDAIEIALEKYLDLQKVPAPTSLESELLKKIKDSNDPPLKKDPEKKDISKAPPKDPPPPKSGNNWMLPLLGMALLASMVGLFWMYSSTNQLKQELADTQAELETLRQECDLTKAENESLKEKVAILQNIDNQPTTLLDPNQASENRLVVYWNPEDQKSYLNTITLPTAPSDRSYQLWAIVDGSPVDMGVIEIDPDSTELIEIPFIENPQAFAVTLETAGGNPTPNLDALVVYGNVS